MSIPVANWPINSSFTSPLKQTTQSDTKQESAASASSSGASSPSVESEFLKIAQMTPEERVQKAILDKLGMSEAEFNKLDAKGKADVMAKVRDEMLRDMEARAGRRTGAFADISV